MLGLVSFFGCGDDDAPADAGLPDEDSSQPIDGAADTGSGQRATFDLRCVDIDGNPLADVWVAVASDADRVEGQSDAAGELTLEVPYEEDSFRAVLALEGYTVLANEAFTIADIDGERGNDGYVELTLTEVSPDVETVRMRLSATGVPSGGRWCAGIGSWFANCTGEGQPVDFRVPVSEIGTRYFDELTGYAVAADGTLVDFLEAEYTVSDGERNVVLAFDTDLPEHRTRSLTIMLPEDPMSPFRTEELDTGWHGWVAVVSADHQLARGAPSNLQFLEDRITLDLHIFEHESGLTWGLAPYANLGQQARTFRWFAEEPTEDVLSFMDTARVTNGSAYTDRFEWTEPESDVDRYQLIFRNNAQRVVLSALSRTNSFELLTLPDGYDREVSFPFPGASGTVQVLANRGTIPMSDANGVTDYQVDGENSSSLRTPITW